MKHLFFKTAKTLLLLILKQTEENDMAKTAI